MSSLAQLTAQLCSASQQNGLARRVRARFCSHCARVQQNRVRTARPSRCETSTGTRPLRTRTHLHVVGPAALAARPPRALGAALGQQLGVPAQVQVAAVVAVPAPRRSSTHVQTSAGVRRERSEGPALTLPRCGVKGGRRPSWHARPRLGEMCRAAAPTTAAPCFTPHSLLAPQYAHVTRGRRVSASPRAAPTPTLLLTCT